MLEHEFAHEYFANSFLGNYDDLWLHEGFASYMQPLATGRERSEEEVYDDHSTGPTGDVYGKGSLILHSLRELIGDADFYD